MTRFHLDRAYHHEVPTGSVIVGHFEFNLEDDSSSVLFYDVTNRILINGLTAPQKTVKFLANCTVFVTELGNSAARYVGQILFYSPTFVFEIGEVRIITPFSSAFGDDMLFHLEYLVALSCRLADFPENTWRAALTQWRNASCQQTQSAQLTEDDVAFCTALIKAFHFSAATE